MRSVITQPATILERFRPAVEQALRQALGTSRLPLYTMLRYHLGWVDEEGRPRKDQAGKLLRPTLYLLACEAVGGDWRRALPGAAAVELVHDFSLIHDDIEDESPERRHRPTVWKLWGQAQAINAGDATLFLAHSTLLRLREQGYPPETVIAAVDILDRACLRMCEGQHLDLACEHRLDLDIPDYLAMVGGKTAALIQASLELGAFLGGADPEVVLGFARCGRLLGLAFQIRDDILGIWGQEATTGKEASDIATRKSTLPVIYALRQAPALRRLYRRRRFGEAEEAQAKQILEQAGARQFAEDMAQGYLQEALALPPLPGCPELKELARFMVERES